MWPLTNKLPTINNVVPPKQRIAAKINAFHGTVCFGTSNWKSKCMKYMNI